MPVTTGEDVWYLHIFLRNKTNKIELENISDQPDRVILLRTGQELQYQKNGGDMSIAVSAEMRPELDDVVAVYWKETAQ